MRRNHLSLVAVALLLAPGLARAQNCVNFGDVPAASPFCQDVEWVKNRAITLGCGDGSNYCPNDAVSRLQMAAFLHRLGTALTPVDVAAPGGSAGAQTPASSPVPAACQTTDYLVTSFPRRAYVNAMATISAPSANIDVQADVVYSINAGPWTPLANSDQYTTLYAGATPPDQSTLAPFGSLDLNVGQSVRFGIRFTLEAGSGTVNVACSTRVQIANRNSSTPPLDMAPTVAERPRGS